MVLVPLKQTVRHTLLLELPHYAGLIFRRCFELCRVYELPRRCRSNDALPYGIQYGIGKGGQIFHG